VAVSMMMMMMVVVVVMIFKLFEECGRLSCNTM
jgi:hypothetical protein